MIRPLLLEPIELQKSWGTEHWLNATRVEAPAVVRGHGLTLATLLERQPELLGEWTRRLFGDELPIFTKVLRADFPPLVHVGFRRVVDRQTLLSWLTIEQDGLRALFAALRMPDEAAFTAFMETYSAWATQQGTERWLTEDDARIADALAPFVDGKIEKTLAMLRENRAHLVDALHEVDLRREAGNLLLTSAGLLHAIFGLSHQFHAIDGSREALQSLIGTLRQRADAGASEPELRALADATDLASLRVGHRATPKNEGWLPLVVEGELVLVEPQQSSDTTFSIADFYTPFVWKDGVRFRKGSPHAGFTTDELARQLDDVDPTVTQLADVRRVPERIASQSGVDVLRLVDDPEHWPFFTAYQLELAEGAMFTGEPARGVFQQIVVVSGSAQLADAQGLVGTVDPSTPAFVPATLTGGYSLTARSAARVLLFSVPGPYREF